MNIPPDETCQMFEITEADHAENEREDERREFRPIRRFCDECGRRLGPGYHDCPDLRPERPTR